MTGNPYLDAVDGYVERPDLPGNRAVWELFDVLDVGLRLRWGIPGAPPYRSSDETTTSADGRGVPGPLGLVHVFAWAIPNDAALDVIAAEAPILEVCAGTGYWSRLLRDRGVDVVATDLLEPDGHFAGITWTDVEPLDAAEAAARYTRVDARTTRTLLLVWPPMSDVADRALAEFENRGGETVIYVGEGRRGCTGDDGFHARLDRGWAVDVDVAIPHFFGLHDYLAVYRRIRPGRPLGLDPNRLKGT